MSRRKPFLLRIDSEILADLERWAKDELRSTNGQIEYLLKQAILRRRGASALAEPSREGSTPGSD